MKKSIIQEGLQNALFTTAYVVLVATFLNNASHLFGPGKSVLIPIVMLLLLIFSAALTGSLVFGKPILWYLDGKKKEALSLLTYTLTSLLVIMILGFVLLAIMSR